MNWDYMSNGWMGGWMWIPLALLLALVVLGTVAVIRASSTGAPERTEAPLAVAARRFAAGEINAEEYQRIRATLSGASQ